MIELLKWFFQSRIAVIEDWFIERKLRKKFQHFNSFAAYWFEWHFGFFKKERERQILLKLSVSNLSNLGDCMFVLANCMNKHTFNQAIEKARFCARSEGDFKKIRTAQLNFFGFYSKEAKAIMKEEEYISKLVRRYLTAK